MSWSWQRRAAMPRRRCSAGRSTWRRAWRASGCVASCARQRSAACDQRHSRARQLARCAAAAGAVGSMRSCTAASQASPLRQPYRRPPPQITKSYLKFCRPPHPITHHPAGDPRQGEARRVTRARARRRARRRRVLRRARRREKGQERVPRGRQRLHRRDAPQPRKDRAGGAAVHGVRRHAVPTVALQDRGPDHHGAPAHGGCVCTCTTARMRAHRSSARPLRFACGRAPLISPRNYVISPPVR